MPARSTALDKYLLAAVIGPSEAEACLVVKPFHSSLGVFPLNVSIIGPHARRSQFVRDLGNVVSPPPVATMPSCSTETHNQLLDLVLILTFRKAMALFFAVLR
jgi:hypothetical protein